MSALADARGPGDKGLCWRGGVVATPCARGRAPAHDRAKLSWPTLLPNHDTKACASQMTAAQKLDTIDCTHVAHVARKGPGASPAAPSRAPSAGGAGPSMHAPQHRLRVCANADVRVAHSLCTRSHTVCFSAPTRTATQLCITDCTHAAAQLCITGCVLAATQAAPRLTVLPRKGEGELPRLLPPPHWLLPASGISASDGASAVARCLLSLQLTHAKACLLCQTQACHSL